MDEKEANGEPGAPRAVLLFDGECGLCQRLVRWLLWLDRGALLRFAPLQGPAAQAFLWTRGLPLEDFDSLVFVHDWAQRDQTVFLLRTAGVIAALRTCGRGGRVLAGALVIFPVGWRDAGYRLVAWWRHRIFGRWKLRPLARAEWAGRFLE